MTADQAYIEGFCKAAEAAGVEPAALMKAALDPVTAGGAAAMALGGAFGGSALTDDDQSLIKRIGKGTAGTALGYLGYKAMTDPRWQAGIRSGTQKVIDIIRGAIGRLPDKFASARTTVKSAGINGWFLPRWLGAGKRYMRLLAGGNVSSLNDRVAKANRVIDRANTRMDAAKVIKDKQTVKNNRHIIDGAKRMAANAQAALDAEREAVAKARLLTGAGVGGVATGMYLLGDDDNDVQAQNYPYYYT